MTRAMAVASVAPPGRVEVQPGSLEQLRQFANGGYLYAILDSTDSPAVPEKAKEAGEEHAVSLFRGSAEEDCWAVAPYLFRVDEALLTWIHDTFWEQPWGVFVMSKTGFEELRRHFRHFLLVQLPDGERWFFRFYDPRILKVYLPACNEQETEYFFGPVRGFALNDPDTQKLWLVHKAANPNPPEMPEGFLWKIRPEQMDALTGPPHRDAAPATGSGDAAE